MYTDIAEHLDSLDHLPSSDLKQAYLGLLLHATAGGLEVRTRRVEGARELLFRDAEGRQPCAVMLDPTGLIFCLRRPLLEWQPGLAAAATERFALQLESDPQNLTDIRIRLQTLADVEEIIAFLRLKPRFVSLGYAAHISA
jgi:hypothetical protein